MYLDTPPFVPCSLCFGRHCQRGHGGLSGSRHLHGRRAALRCAALPFVEDLQVRLVNFSLTKAPKFIDLIMLNVRINLFESKMITFSCH